MCVSNGQLRMLKNSWPCKCPSQNSLWKVMRATIQGVADSSLVRVPATIENVAVLDDIQGVLQGLGYAKGKPLKFSEAFCSKFACLNRSGYERCPPSCSSSLSLCKILSS
ncbi:hypothetical protein Plhal304r1_c053g0138381 [Plasmopara halstedii]